MKRLAFWGVVLAAAAFLRQSNPVGIPWMPECPFHAWTGLHCPGCGSLRAFHALLHGHLATALHDNLLTVLALPCLLYALQQEVVGDAAHPLLRSSRTAWIALAVMLLFAAVRNLPLWPCTLLAPL